MGWVDIVFIVVLVLFAIIGLAKGLFESILGIFSSVLSVGVAIMVQKPVTALINKIVDTNKFFGDLLVNWGWISPEGTTAFGKTYTVAQIGNACTVIVSIIAVWLLIKLAVLLLSKLFDSATTRSSALSGLNRVLGLVFGAAKGFIIVVVGLGLASVLNICGVSNINSTMEANPMSNFIYKYVNEWVGTTLEDRIDDVLGKGTLPGTDTGSTEGSGEEAGEGTGTEAGGEESAVTYTMLDGTQVNIVL